MMMMSRVAQKEKFIPGYSVKLNGPLLQKQALATSELCLEIYSMGNPCGRCMVKAPQLALHIVDTELLPLAFHIPPQ